MRKYLNHGNIPLALAVFLATDNYDHEEDVISATTLLKPIRQTVLAKRVPKEESLVDIGSLVASRIGSAIHDAIERSWVVSPEMALKALGYPSKVISRIRVNPAPEEDLTDCIPVYLEQRAYKQVGKYKISGKFDFVGDGSVQDFKTTSVFTYMNQTNADKYILQGSIYRWLNPQIITQDFMKIHYIFTDWASAKAKTEAKYPNDRILSQTYNLKSIEQTEAFVLGRIKLIDEYMDAPEQEIPECSDEELWRKETVWKYYKNAEKVGGRSTKNFDSFVEAQQRYIEDGSTGAVVEVKGQVVACRYCDAFSVCTQKDRLIQSGDLVLPTA